jgi:hypothetical protein
MDLKTGDILFVNKNTIWGGIVGYFQGDPYHHVGVIINVYGETYVFEALSVGMAFTPYQEYLDKNFNKGYSLLVKRHKDNPFHKIPTKDIMNFCLPLTDRPYEFSNLIGFQFIRMVYMKMFGRNLWIGRSQKKSKRSLICSELVALFYNNFTGMFEDNWHKAAPSDIINVLKLETVLKLD